MSVVDLPTKIALKALVASDAWATYEEEGRTHEAFRTMTASEEWQEWVRAQNADFARHPPEDEEYPEHAV